MADRYRLPVGILEAATLLVVAGMALWGVKPIPGAREAAAAERDALKTIGALADALEKAGGPYRRPQAAPEGCTASPVAGTWSRGPYWVTVLLPAREGWLAPPGKEHSGEASRGFCVVAWPRKEAPEVLRALVALPQGFMWQRSDGMEESGDPAVPPVPRASLAPPGPDAKIPSPPPDWTIARKRR